MTSIAEGSELPNVRTSQAPTVNELQGGPQWERPAMCRHAFGTPLARLHRLREACPAMGAALTHLRHTFGTPRRQAKGILRGGVRPCRWLPNYNVAHSVPARTPSVGDPRGDGERASRYRDG